MASIIKQRIQKYNSNDEKNDMSARISVQGIIPNLSITLPQSNFNRFINQRSPNQTKKFINKGSFGVIYQNNSHPDRVIKIFGPYTNVVAEKAKATRMANITGNDRQRVEVVHITKNDVPSNALAEYKSLNTKQLFMKNRQSIPALSMPYLGINLFTYLDKRPFNLPEELYIKQCHKLLQQTYKLYRSRHSHGDLRAENIVFDGTEMTMIDFDIFGTFEEVEKMYVSLISTSGVRSWTPPECLLFNTSNLNDYISKLFSRSQVYFLSTGKTLNNLKTLIKESNEKNRTYMLKDHKMSMIDVIPYFDNFGLGIALLEVLATLYPKTDNPTLIKIRCLLEKITHFEISERITPDIAFEEMGKIYKNKLQGGAKCFTRKNQRKTYKNTRPPP